MSFVIGKEDVRKITLLNVLQRSVTLNKSKVVSHSEEDSKVDDDDQSSGQNLRQALAAARFENCAICGSDSLSPNDTTTPGKLSEASDFDKSEEDDGDECHKAMEIVPVNGPEDSGGSITMLVRKLPESRPGWPLLRRAVSTLGQSVTPHSPLSKQIPVVQWAMKLPPRDTKQLGYDSSENNLSSLNAIVPIGINSISKKSFPDNDNSPKKLPEELEGLYERFSSTCRFFKYKELVSVTSNFSAGWSFSPLYMDDVYSS